MPTWRTRPAPSEPRQPLLDRPRLATVMAGRWQRRLTVVVAGAGFGKSGLLGQALEANRRAPLGHDAWIGCQEEDTGLDRFFEAIFTAVRGTPPADGPLDLDDAVQRIADAVWSHAPAPVAIVVDDVHVLGEDSAGSALLDAIVRRLPANARFLLASRTSPPVPLARLISAGEAVVLDESDLVMTPAELAAFAEVRNHPDLDLIDTGGWPALAELAVHAGTSRSPELAEYLTGELLSDLPKSQVEALAVLSVVGPLHPEQIAAVAGDLALDVGALTRLPLVNSVGGLVEAHSLWELAVSSVDQELLLDRVRSVAQMLRESAFTERAFRLALAGDDEDLALEILGELCREAIHTAADIDLGACVAALPPDRRSDPAALLATALSSDEGGWSHSRDRLIDASLALEAAGAAELELIALTRLGTQGWQAGDLSVADHLLPRIERLAGSGDPLAVGVALLGTAVLDEIVGDREAMWEHVAAFEALDVPEPLLTMGARYRASIELSYGSPAEAIRRMVPLEAAAPPWLRVEVRVLLLWACWLQGDVRAAHEWADQLRLNSGDDGAGIVARSSVGLIDAWSPMAAGDRGRNRQGDVGTLVAGAAVARDEGLLNPAMVSLLAAATHLVADGDEAAAQALLAEAFADPEMVPARVLPAVIRALALVWVLLPERREELGLDDLGPGTAGAVGAARALEAARAADPGDTSWHGDARLVLADSRLPTRLPPIWAAELASRYVGAKPDDDRLTVALDAVDHLGPTAPPALRRLAARRDDRALAAGASAVLARRTPVSEGRFVLRLLGPMVLEHDGEVIEEPDWRRDRVRGLFALIARHGTISRRAAADVLWADLDPDAAANNLRVTLSYLQKVLEPERSRHEVSYHVRGDGAVLRFAGRSSWTVDVEEFEALLDAAERDDRRGEPAAALPGYLAAIDWYRGPFLADVELGASDEIERDRLRSRYVRALIRAGGLLLAVGSVEEAQRLAVAAQVADPWSDEALLLQAEAYLAVGDRAAALRTQRRAAALATELGLPPSPDLERIGRSLAV